jgi:DNA helicase-2/ATP-dependent DNA helicase PcrA
MNGQKLSDFAILVRAGFQTREFEERLLTLAIPYKVIGGPRFYERMEIRDALAYLRLVIQPNDGMAFERIINTPRRGIGQATMQNIHILVREQQMSLPAAAMNMLDNDQIRGKAKIAMISFFEGISRWRGMLTSKHHKEIAEIILDESGYINMWRQDKSADAPGRVENLKELITAIGTFDSLPDFLEHVRLVMENSNQADGSFVTVMTLHSAKGLEFDTVFLAGWEEALFPHQRSLDEEGIHGLEEERRLAYVGLTRAKRNATITYSLSRKTYKGWQPAVPSRFIKELPTEHITNIHPSGQQVTKSRSRVYNAGNESNYGQKAYLREDNNYQGKTIDAVSNTSKFAPGDCVTHASFGKGYVTEVHGDKLAVNFEKIGIKKVMARFCDAID